MSPSFKCAEGTHLNRYTDDKQARHGRFAVTYIVKRQEGMHVNGLNSTTTAFYFVYPDGARACMHARTRGPDQEEDRCTHQSLS